MKRTGNILTLVSLTILFFSFHIFSQNSVTKKEFEEKANQEEIKVKLFVNSFIKSLEKTKDIDKVPRQFFVIDFKHRLSNTNFIELNYGDFDYELGNKIRQKERYEYNTLWINFYYLLMMYNGATKSDAEIATIEEKANGELFPPEIINLFRQSKTLNSFFENDDYQIKNVTELRATMIDLKKVVNTQRNLINKLEHGWETKYEERILKSQKEYYSYQSKLSTRNGLYKLPYKTQYFETVLFPFNLTIIYQKGRLKILHIGLFVND